MSTDSESASKHVTLRDNLPVTIRPIQPDDAPRLQALHTRLSPETVYRRFLSVHPLLSDAEAWKLANVDYVNQMAFVATLAVSTAEAVVGVARYATLGRERPGEAEAAVVVEDRYQSQGLGTMLLERLLDYARTHGVHTFVAAISSHNESFLRFIEERGFPMEKRLDAGVWEIRLKLPEAAAGEA